MTPTDDRVAQQRTTALRLANEVRCSTAATKRRIAAMPEDDGARIVADGLRGDDFGAVKIGDLVLAIRWVGAQKAGRLLRAAGIASPDKHVRDLTGRQRLALADLLAYQADEGRRAA